MSVNGQSDNQSEVSFNIISGSEIVMKLEDNTNGDKPEDNTNMDVDKTTQVSGAASGSEGIFVVPAVATLQAGIADDDGVSSAPTLQAGIADVPAPPPGNGGSLLIQHQLGSLVHCRPRCRLRWLNACTVW